MTVQVLLKLRAQCGVWTSQASVPIPGGYLVIKPDAGPIVEVFAGIEAKRSRCLKIDCKLEFDVKVIPHKGDTDWIEPLIFKMNDCLRGETIPAANPTCEYCGYREAAGKELQARVKKPVTKSNKSATLGI